MKNEKIKRVFPINEIFGMLMRSRTVNKVKFKLERFLDRIEVQQMKRICLFIIVVMFVADIVLLIRAGNHVYIAPQYIAPPVFVPQSGRRNAGVLADRWQWESQVADTVAKESWDSLLRFDTVSPYK